MQSPTQIESEPNKTKDGLKPKAKSFFVAYTLDEAGGLATRPVTFALTAAPAPRQSGCTWPRLRPAAPISPTKAKPRRRLTNYR